jgi:hypothetical protein
VSLLVVLRVLAVVLGLQVSGAAHFVEDAVALVTAGHTEHDEQCPADGPCDDCPPGCAQCHCSNALRSAVPSSHSALVPLLEVSKTAACGAVERPPLSPDLPSLFRPPQFARAVA